MRVNRQERSRFESDLCWSLRYERARARERESERARERESERAREREREETRSDRRLRDIYTSLEESVLNT